MSNCKICDPKNKYFDCICCDNWKDFEIQEKKIKEISDDLIKSALKISTITLCFNLNSSIDIKQLKIDYPPNKSATFYNSIIYNWHTKYQYKTIVSVKIFPNGKIQVAGLATIMACAYIIRKINKKILKYLNEESYLSNVKIAMINSDFKLKSSINIVEFCNILSKLTINEFEPSLNKGAFLNVIYQPIKYPAINSKFICSSNIQSYYDHYYMHGAKKKFKSTISVLIFRSGSIIITGGNLLSDYNEIYLYLLEIIKNNILKLQI